MSNEEEIKDRIAAAMGLEIRYNRPNHKYYAEIDEDGHPIAMSDVVGRVYVLFLELQEESA